VVTVLAGAVIAFAPYAAFAQSAALITFQHDGDGVTGFALYAESRDAKPARVDLGMVPADARGNRTVVVPPLPDGTYALSVAAYNAKAESVRVPAAPAIVRVKNGLTDVDRGDAPARQAAAPPPVAPAAKGAPAEGAAERPAGALGRFWRILVGDD
jgi:hypothetical protein